MAVQRESYDPLCTNLVIRIVSHNPHLPTLLSLLIRAKGGTEGRTVGGRDSRKCFCSYLSNEKSTTQPPFATTFVTANKGRGRDRGGSVGGRASRESLCSYLVNENSATQPSSASTFVTTGKCTIFPHNHHLSSDSF